MKDMHWYVYVHRFNENKIDKWDIFNHGRFNDYVKEAYKKYKNDFNAFEEQVKKDLNYCFWSKCEYEIILSSWPPSEKVKEEKIDVADQVLLNWDVFIKYVWERAHARKNSKDDIPK